MIKNSEKPTTPKQLVEEILKINQVKNSKGESIPLRGSIDIAEGEFLEKIVSENSKVSNTLEIGCAFGVSSIFICIGLENKEQPKHTILDPFQHQNYDGIGLLNLRRAGFDFVNFIEEYSEFALPTLLKENENSFDLIFIDGLHTFDQVMLDFYYANRLIKIGGFIVFDDCGFRSISSALTYILKYPSYVLFDQVTTKSTLKKFVQGIIKIIPRALIDTIFPNFLKTEINRLRFNSMVAIQKITEDKRNNRWFTNF